MKMKQQIQPTQQISFDQILENKIGFGKYQIIAIGFLCLVDFNDGVELLSMSILMPILKREWEISQTWVEILSSIFYLGMFIGALLTGRIADNKGRVVTLIYASSFQFLVAFSFSFANDILVLTILRFLYSFCYGFSLPLTISMVSEITPLNYRGKCIIFTNFCVSIGKIWGIILSYLVLKDLSSGNWRLLMILCSLSSLIVVIGVSKFVRESPRFLISIGKLKEAEEILNHISFINNDSNLHKPVTQEEINGLSEYYSSIFKIEDQANPRVLINDKNFSVTIRLWIIWFSLIFVEFGQYVLLPFILISSKSGFGTLLFAVIGELPAIFFSFYFIDLKNLGRKNTLTICVFFFGLFNFMAYVLSKDYLAYILSIERFLMKNSFSMLVPLTSEMYPTNYRTVGYGFATSVGRMAATLSPYILLPLFYRDHYSGFIVFTILSLLATMASNTLPYDTSGKYLDTFITKSNDLL
jgi:MFS family permease